MKKEIMIVSIFLTLFTVILFRQYILQHTVALPYNLLVSSYAPWKFETQFSRIPNKPLGFDNLKLFIPFRKYTTESLAKGIIPLWNPYVFSGNVHLASYQAAIFSPVSLFYALLPFDDAWTVVTMIQPILAGIGMYILLRTLNRSRKASLLGMLGWAFCGWMITNWQEVHVQIYTFLYLPFALAASLQIWQSTGKKQLILHSMLYILFCTLSVFGGFLQMSIYFFVILGCWNIFVFFQSKNRSRLIILSYILMLTLIVLGITAIQWMPAFEAFLLSPRGIVDSKVLFETFLSPVWFLLTFLFPDFWGNQGSYNYSSPLVFVTERTIWIAVPVLIFGITALFMKKKQSPFLWFWTALTLITLSLGFNLPTSWLFYLFQIPIMSVAQPSRIFIAAALGMSVLSAYGFDALKENGVYAICKKICFILSFLCLAVSGWILLLSLFLLYFRQPGHVCTLLSSFKIPCSTQLLQMYMNISLRNTVLPLILFLLFWLVVRFFRTHQTLIWITAVCIVLLSTFYQSNKILYFSNRSFAYPSLPVIEKTKELAGFSRATSIGDGYILRNFLSYYQIYAAEGYDALFPQWYGELLYAAKTNGTFETQITRTDADLTVPGKDEPITKNPYRLRLMQLTGVHIVLQTKEEQKTNPLPSDQFELLWQDTQWTIYRYTKAYPRTFLSKQAVSIQDTQELFNALFQSDYQPSEKIFIQESPPDIPFYPESSDTAVIESYEPHRVKIVTSSEYPRMLYLSDTYYPGWKALVNGKETKIYKANYAFRAVYVPEGNNTVMFVYDPLSWKISVVISLVSITGFIVILLFIFLKKRG